MKVNDLTDEVTCYKARHFIFDWKQLWVNNPKIPGSGSVFCT